MNFANGKRLLIRARGGKYAIGAFNFQDMEILQAIIRAANKEKSPVIIQTSEGAIEYAGLDYIYEMALAALKESKVPVVLHLDHGESYDMAVRCVKIGYSSIMIDASRFGFEKNVKLTRKVASYAHNKGVGVEGELGRLKGVEDHVKVRDKESFLTQPEAAKEFVERTGVDYLAVAIGTSHGPYKFKGKSNLDFKRLEKISKIVKIPLVLHGASSVYSKDIRLAKKMGAKLEGAKGVSNNDLKKAIKLGVAKINTDTDLRIAFITAARKAMIDKKVIDIRKVLGPVREAVEDKVQEKIKVFGSRGKAR